MAFVQTDNDSFDEALGCVKVPKGEDYCSEEDDDRNQVTPQNAIDSLTHHIIRQNGPYLRSDVCCGICFSKYNVGDRIICLPCQHNFHEYCIENWLRWVKSSCPIDKKSIIRRHYRDNLANERRQHLLKAYAQNEINVEVCSVEEDGSASCGEGNIFDDNDCQALSKEKRGLKKFHEKEMSKAYAPKLLTPLGVKEVAYNITEPSDILTEKPKFAIKNIDLKCDDKTSDKSDAIFDKHSHQLRDSVDAIRQSIKSKESRIKKVLNLKKFEAALDKTVAKLSEASIQPLERKSGGDNYKFQDLRHFVLKTSPTENKDIEEHTSVRGFEVKRSMNFGDVLASSSQVKSGWAYTRNKPVTCPKEIRTYSRSPDKKL